jgi:GlpG protein
MPAPHTVFDAPIEEDLLPLTGLLRSRGLPHQIFEENGRQVLVVFAEEHVAPVRDLYRAWRAGEVRIEVDRQRSTAAVRRTPVQWRESPVTVTVAAISIVLFISINFFGADGLLPYLTFLPFEIVNRQLVFGDMGSQYWRLVTPAFVHFGWLHITFNCLWLWELGRRCEQVLGSWNTAGLMLVIAVVSNCCQHLYGGPGLFGGLSGVVYGLLGFAWVAPLLQPAWRIQPPSVIMLFMVGWLVLGVLGVIEAVGFGAIANAAHIGGLVSGALLGVVLGALSRSQSGPT